MSETLRIAAEMALCWQITPGAAMAHFRAGLVQGRIEALECDGCGRRQLPPRPFCGDCRLPLQRWVGVSDVGTLLAWTQLHVPIADARTGEPRPVPACMGLIQLDGADTSLNHHLCLVGGDKPVVGARVRARWRSERRGAMDDIESFELLGEESTLSVTPPVSLEPNAEPTRVDLRLTFRYAAGAAVGTFLEALRDGGAVLAARCQDCSAVRCPPTACCPRCGADGHELLPVGPDATLESWTELPDGRVFGLFRLLGVHTPILHNVLGAPSHRDFGARYRLRLAPVRRGHILDIEGFAPIALESQ